MKVARVGPRHSWGNSWYVKVGPWWFTYQSPRSIPWAWGAALVKVWRFRIDRSTS